MRYALILISFLGCAGANWSDEYFLLKTQSDALAYQIEKSCVAAAQSADTQEEIQRVNDTCMRAVILHLEILDDLSHLRDAVREENLTEVDFLSSRIEVKIMELARLMQTLPL